MINDADALLVRAMREAAEIANPIVTFPDASTNPDRVALRLIEWYHRGARDVLASWKQGAVP